MIRPMNPGDRQAYISMAAAFYASGAVIKKVTVQVVESVFDDIMAGSPHIEGYMLLDEAGAGAGYMRCWLIPFPRRQAAGCCGWMRSISAPNTEVLAWPRSCSARGSAWFPAAQTTT